MIKHALPLLAVLASNLGPCSGSSTQSESRPPAPTVIDVPMVDTFTPAPPPVRRARDPNTLAKLWRGQGAVALITPGAKWLIVQRATNNASLRFDSVNCDGAGSSRGGEATTRCTFESAGCRGTLTVVERFVIGGGGGSLTVTIEPNDAGAMCAQVAGEFNGLFGGPIPPPPPQVPNVACFTGRHVLSSDANACSVATATTLESFSGPCCIGTSTGRWPLRGDASKRWIATDGRTLVVAHQGETVSPANIQANGELFQVYRTGTAAVARTLRVRDVFAGDPILQGTTSFSINTSIDDAGNLVVSSIGGASHSIPLAR